MLAHYHARLYYTHIRSHYLIPVAFITLPHNVKGNQQRQGAEQLLRKVARKPAAKRKEMPVSRAVAVATKSSTAPKARGKAAAATGRPKAKRSKQSVEAQQRAEAQRARWQAEIEAQAVLMEELSDESLQEMYV